MTVSLNSHLIRYLFPSLSSSTDFPVGLFTPLQTESASVASRHTPWLRRGRPNCCLLSQVFPDSPAESALYFFPALFLPAFLWFQEASQWPELFPLSSLLLHYTGTDDWQYPQGVTGYTHKWLSFSRSKCIEPLPRGALMVHSQASWVMNQPGLCEIA